MASAAGNDALDLPQTARRVADRDGGRTSAAAASWNIAREGKHVKQIAMTAAVVTGLALGGEQAAEARVTGFRILEQGSFADGAVFGPAGAYVRVRAVASGELDPKAPENADIADLDLAPRDANGMVHYDTDLFILRPADPAKGSGVLLYDVTNRGNKFLMGWVNDAPEPGGSFNDPRTLADAGNGFTFRRGDTMVWSDWESDVRPGSGRMMIRVPGADGAGTPPVGRVRDEIVSGTRVGTVAESVLPYPAASTDPSGARLTVRAREADPEVDVPAGGWEFVGDGRAIRLLPAGTPFEPIKLYEFRYDAKAPVVSGVGFAATRDAVSFLRYGGEGNPLLGADGRPTVAQAVSFGVSLSGRFLRHFLELGMNRDEDERRVFDGVYAHISGAGKVFGNQRWAMPSRTATQHEDKFYPENWFPFGYARAADPASGQTGSLLRGDGSDPLVIESNTSTEYWQKGASLVHTDPASGTDLAQPPTVRVFMIAGTEHAGHAGVPGSAGACAEPRNPHSTGPAFRALIAALEDWVAKGAAPPDSRVPHQADGSGVPADKVRLPAIPKVIWAPGANLIGPPVNWINPPARVENPYPTFVSAVDVDGNETAGLRLPDIAVPLGTFTGTNVYAAYPTELCDRDGTYLPFARTRAEREETGDPRLSLEERYGPQTAYVTRVREAAERLVAARLLLPEDAERYVRAAEAARF